MGKGRDDAPAVKKPATLCSKARFADDTIIQCVNWYLLFKLSYRDLALKMGQLGVSVAPSTILRW